MGDDDRGAPGEHLTTAQIDAIHAYTDPARAGYELDTYRATSIALYSSYRLPAPPIRALTNEWDDPLTSAGIPLTSEWEL